MKKLLLFLGLIVVNLGFAQTTKKVMDIADPCELFQIENDVLCVFPDGMYRIDGALTVSKLNGFNGESIVFSTSTPSLTKAVGNKYIIVPEQAGTQVFYLTDGTSVGTRSVFSSYFDQIDYTVTQLDVQNDTVYALLNCNKAGQEYWDLIRFTSENDVVSLHPLYQASGVGFNEEPVKFCIYKSQVMVMGFQQVLISDFTALGTKLLYTCPTSTLGTYSVQDIASTSDKSFLHLVYCGPYPEGNGGCDTSHILVSDGTSNGTKFLLNAITTNKYESGPPNLRFEAAGNQLVYRGQGSEDEFMAYYFITDGTISGTKKISDSLCTDLFTFRIPQVAIDNKFYFVNLCAESFEEYDIIEEQRNVFVDFKGGYLSVPIYLGKSGPYFLMQIEAWTSSTEDLISAYDTRTNAYFPIDTVYRRSYIKMVSNSSGTQVFYKSFNRIKEKEELWVYLVESGNSIKEQNFTFSLQPNPASQQVLLTLPQSGVYQVEVLNSTGVVIKHQKLIGASQQIDTSPWSPGLYLVRVVQNGVTHTEKLIIQ